jgi:ligand-binding SRPBCC domain-containing protein
MGSIRQSSELAADIEDVFAFHLDTRNAARIAAPGQRLLRIEGTFPVVAGAIVTLRMLQLPIPVPQRWVVRIAVVERPTRIVDVMLRGPFAAWRHEHRFAALDPGRTRLTDEVAYVLPLGALGRLADALVVNRLLRAAFRARQARTRKLLEAR